MAVRHRDVKDVSRLVTKKLEMYMNLERRENRFDPSGPFRTTPKMHKFDFMYKVLDKVVLDKLPSERKSDGTSNSKSETQSTPRQASDRKRHTSDGSKFEEDSSNTKSTTENEDSATKQPAHRIKPQLEQTSRSVVLNREAERLANYANKVFEEIPLQKLQLIHRHRPAYSHTIPDKPEFGKCQGYSRHVGAVLHSEKFVDYYVKEGLHVGMSKRKDLKESQKFCCNTASPREKMKRSKTGIAKPRQSGYELGLYRTKTRMSRKLPSHNKSPPYKQSLDSTTTSEFSSSVRSDHVPSRPFQPAQKRYNSSKDIQEMKENDISLSNDQKNVAQLDTHSENGKIKSRKCVLQEKERIDPKLVENKHDQKNMMPRDYNEHSIFNVNANTGPKLPSFSLESSTTSSILKEETHSNFRQITVSEAPKDERTSTPISPKKDQDHFADKIGNVRTVFCDAETTKLDSVSITEVENNVTHEGTKQEESEHEGEISDKKDANQNVQETTSSHHGNTHKTDEAQEIIKLPNILYADLSQTNAALTDKRLIKTEKSDIVAATKVDTTGEEQSDTKSNSESEISVTSNTEKEKTPMDKYEDKLWNSFGDAKEQQKENTSFEEGVIRDDEIKEAKQDKDVIIEKNNVKDDDKSTEEEYNYRKHSQDMSEKLTEDVNHEVNLLGAEDNIPSDHCANETSNWSRTLKQETSFSDNERNETVTEQHISSGLSEDSLSRLANQKRHSLTLSDNNTDKTDSTVTEVNNKPSSETEQVKVLTAIHSSVVDLSDDEYSDMSSSEDDISEGNVSDVTGGQIENIENTRSGMPDENTLVEDPRTKNAEKVTSIQEENEHVKPDVDISDAIIHDPKTLDDVTNDIDPTVVTEYNNADLSVPFKHKNPEKCEKELLLEQKSELEPHSVKDSETRNKSHETEEQTTEMEIPKETRTDAIVGVLQKANEESNVMHVNNLEKQEWQEERSEELVEKIAEERSLGLENGTVSDKDVLYSEIQVNMNLQDETDEHLRKEKETIKLNLESELTVSTHAETDIEIKSHSIKDSETRKSPETEDQTTEMEIPKETGTVVTGEILKDSDEQSDIMNVNNLEIQEWQEEKSEEFVEVIAEERSLRLESGNVSDKDAVYCETQAKVNLHYETDEPLTKAKETVALNQELVLTMSTQAETYAETKPMDSSTNISGIGAHRRTGTSESPVPDPDTNEGQYDISKEIKEPSISEEHDRMTVKENGQHIETQTVLDEENILATKKLEESPNVSESEIERDSISDNEIPGCRQNDTESYAKPESLNFDHTISMSTEDSKAEEIEHETNVEVGEEERKDEEKSVTNKDDERREYNLGVLKQIQLIFGNLAASRLQYYVPRGFWKHFKLWGEPVNLREQHDALEFFNSLVDSLDESLKTLDQPAILSKVMGGSFADQKICKDCPHRYQREEPFTTLNVDIRNHQNLLESLEQYVKGDLLEGANAYHCDKCNKKVDTVKRLLIKKLPRVLAIQLKRFDYDWERESAIKFNDYFEFPREFDMEPYTVQGLAKIEGEIIDADCDEKGQCTKYKLIGVVVHSGQASGGHYYSYILHRGADRIPKWYKFDDGDVSECKMEDDEEMKNQCFGGEYLGEVFDHMLKRMAYRRQKRWWNAYILFYERQDEYEEDKITKNIQDLTLSSKTCPIKIPASIEKCVRKHNILFMHERTHFSLEYFQFMKKLLNCNQMYTHSNLDKMVPDAEQLSMISIELASKFLFTVGFHTKKTLRGPANEWYEALNFHLRLNKNVRSWFTHNVLFPYPNRFSEYLLECPSSEVRSAFCKIIVCLAHYSLQDGPVAPPLVQGLYAGQVADPSATQSDHLLMAILQLLKKEVSDHGRNLQQYFHLFLMYANLGLPERSQLLKLNVPAQFMSVALDEGPGPPIKYQYAELTRLYSVVSLLIRCCDVSPRCHSSTNGEPLPNPHGDVQPPLLLIQTQVAEMLFSRTSYVKKLIEDCNNNEDTTKLLRFCCWENPHFSSTVLSELLWQVAYSYTYELRPYLDLLLQMLMLEDSWQNHRIHNALKGIPEDRDGLFDTIQRSKSHYQKRAYQCIKMLVALFTHCTPATSMLHTNGDLKRKWTHAVEWLHDELDRRPYPGNAQYTYNNWSPPAQSNETSNGYFLERSQSARITLTKAIALCPEEEPEEGDLTDDPENPPADDQSPGPTPQGQSPSPSPGQPAPQNGQQPGQVPQQSQQQAHTSSQQTPPQSTSPVQQGQGKQMAEKDQQTQQVPVQNNQVKVNGHLPVQPNNQINNELNQIEIPQSTTDLESTSESIQGNPDTGEEERPKEAEEINNTNNNHPGKSSPNTTK